MNKVRTGQDTHAPAADEMLARVAHMYYVLGLTQAEAADRLRITRFKVNRMLAQARERGMVRIEIDVPYAARLHLERQLEDRYALESAFVCPSDSSEAMSLSQVIGRYAAPVVAGFLDDGMTIATSWGETLRALAVAINRDAARDLCVASMLGSLTSQTDLGKYGAAATLADSLGAECLFIPGPIICDSVETRCAINAQPAAQLAMERARNADIALLSVGGRGLSSLREASILSDDVYEVAIRAGAIGNFLGRFIGIDGEPLDHDLNDRAVGIGPDEMGLIPRRILCAGGTHKSDAIRAVMLRGYANTLVTDEATAHALLSPPSSKPS